VAAGRPVITAAGEQIVDQRGPMLPAGEVRDVGGSWRGMTGAPALSGPASAAGRTSGMVAGRQLLPENAALADRVAKLQPGLATVYMSGCTAGLPGPQPDLARDGAARIQKPFGQQTLLEVVRTALGPGPWPAPSPPAAPVTPATRDF
jgi:hypothetical protein